MKRTRSGLFRTSRTIEIGAQVTEKSSSENPQMPLLGPIREFWSVSNVEGLDKESKTAPSSDGVMTSYSEVMSL